MTRETIDLKLDGHVAHVVLKRGDAFNTMTPAFWREIRDVFAEIDATPDARVVVLSSTGRHFTAGMDLSVFTTMTAAGTKDEGRRREALRRSVLEYQESFNVVERARVPVIAAIQGGCIGGGVDLIAACDMRYCTADAYLCIQEINIGIVADVGTLQRLPYLMPEGMVRELAYTGRRLPAARARELGIVNEVYADHAAMMEGVTQIAREIAAQSPLAVAGSKEMLNFTRDHSVADGLNYIATWNAGMLTSADMVEAMTAKKEKRAPVYENLLPAARHA
jgi:enoyl-CoA hydratase